MVAHDLFKTVPRCWVYQHRLLCYMEKQTVDVKKRSGQGGYGVNLSRGDEGASDIPSQSTRTGMAVLLLFLPLLNSVLSWNLPTLTSSLGPVVNRVLLNRPTEELVNQTGCRQYIHGMPTLPNLEQYHQGWQ